MNALLSFVYTMLYHDLRSALETTGLDPAVGFLHRDRPGRMSLALDLMEEFRPLIAERLVLSLINLKQIERKDLSVSESGAVLLSEAEEDRSLRLPETKAGHTHSSLSGGRDARRNCPSNSGPAPGPPHKR